MDSRPGGSVEANASTEALLTRFVIDTCNVDSGRVSRTLIAILGRSWSVGSTVYSSVLTGWIQRPAQTNHSRNQAGVRGSGSCGISPAWCVHVLIETNRERQWSSATSSGGAQRLCILRRYPYPVYGTAGPVGGGPRGDYRRSADPNPIWMGLGWERG